MSTRQLGGSATGCLNAHARAKKVERQSGELHSTQSKLAGEVTVCARAKKEERQRVNIAHSRVTTAGRAATVVLMYKSLKWNILRHGKVS